MNTEAARNFQARIVGASRNDLVIINYEMLMTELEEARGYLDQDNRQLFEGAMGRASKLLTELTVNLDFSYDISRDLMSLYIFVNKKLIEATRKYSSEPLTKIHEVLSTLLVGWKEANKTAAPSEAAMQNGQQLYAGLTYGKGQLNETVYDQNNRGFRA